MPILGVIASSISGNLTPPVEFQGDYWAIASVTVPSGGLASISFAGIPSDFTHLQVRAILRSTTGAGDGTITMRFNNDTGSNYSWHRLYGYGSGTGGTDNSTSTTGMAVGQSMGATPSLQSFPSMITDVLDYSSAVKNKTVRSLSGTDMNGDASGAIFFNSGAWYNTSPVTSITIITNQTAFAEFSTFALYGVR